MTCLFLVERRDYGTVEAAGGSPQGANIPNQAHPRPQRAAISEWRLHFPSRSLRGCAGALTCAASWPARSSCFMISASPTASAVRRRRSSRTAYSACARRSASSRFTLPASCNTGRHLEQFREQRLAGPEAVFDGPVLDARPAVRRLVKDQSPAGPCVNRRRHGVDPPPPKAA
jgi:hypothetical protein